MNDECQPLCPSGGTEVEDCAHIVRFDDPGRTEAFDGSVDNFRTWLD